MAQVLMFTSPYFRGTITDTPSGSAYHVVPGQTVVVQEADVALLQTFGFTAAAPPVSSGGALTLSDTNSHTIPNTSTIIVGSGGTVSGSGGVGTITGFGGGGGGGSYIEVESGSSTKISATPTLTNPPPGPVYDAVITNDGTTTTNYQRPQGVIVQPAATGSDNGLGITLATGAPGPSGSSPGALYIHVANVTAAGTAEPLAGSAFTLYGGTNIITDPAGASEIGTMVFQGQGSYNGIIAAYGAYWKALGGTTNGTTLATGGGNLLTGGRARHASSSVGGYLSMQGGYGDTQGGDVYVFAGNSGGTGGNITIGPGGAPTNGVLLVQNIGTADPHILNAKFQSSIAGVGYVGVYSKG